MKKKYAQSKNEPTHAVVARVIRQRILDSKWLPGKSVPTHKELLKAFGVGDLTIRKAVATLVSDGFLTSTKRKGTYVTDTPPNLTHIGVVFPHSLASRSHWSPFYSALADEAENLAQSSPYRASLYERTESSLALDAEAGKFAGLIFTSPPYGLADSPALANPRIPRIAIMAQQQITGIPGIIWFDFRSFTEKAVEFLSVHGRRNIAMLTTVAPGSPDSYADHFRASLAKRGIEIPSFWIQQNSPDLRSQIHLLMHAGQTRRPDALIVTEDTLLEQALAGLIAAGVRVPEDVEVVTHANFPSTVPCMLPVTRLGYDIRHMFRECIRLIELQRRRQSVPLVTRIPVVFESELGK